MASRRSTACAAPVRAKAALLKERGWSISLMATHCGLSETTVRKALAEGRPTVTARVAEAVLSLPAEPPVKVERRVGASRARAAVEALDAAGVSRSEQAEACGMAPSWLRKASSFCHDMPRSAPLSVVEALESLVEERCGTGDGGDKGPRVDAGRTVARLELLLSSTGATVADVAEASGVDRNVLGRLSARRQSSVLASEEAAVLSVPVPSDGMASWAVAKAHACSLFDRGLSVKEVALEAGVSQSALQGLLKADPAMADEAFVRAVCSVRGRTKKPASGRGWTEREDRLLARVGSKAEASGAGRSVAVRAAATATGRAYRETCARMRELGALPSVA